MSHSEYIGVLSHYQPIGCRAAARIPSDVAEDLVRRMVAERISQKLIRLFGSDSPFQVLKHVACSRTTSPIPDGLLAPVELPGLHLEFPKNCEGASMASVRAGWDWDNA